MPFIGRQPTAAALTSDDLADNIVTVDKLATTLDLSSNTVTLPSGVGGSYILLNTSSSSTDVASFSFDDTYINSTYDTYFVQGTIEVQTTNTDMNIRFTASGSEESGLSDYEYEVQNIAGATEEDSTNHSIKISRNNLSSTAGNQFDFQFLLVSSQDSGDRTQVMGQNTYKSYDAGHISALFGGQRVTAKVNDGFSMFATHGNIQGTINLYGVKS